jgi:NAD(P) transhydrogenase subunit beta
MREILIPLAYLLSAVLFILGIKGLTRVRTARRGNLLGAGAMLLAVVTTLVEMGRFDLRWILAGLVVGGLVGAVAAMRVQMTAMPEMVALLNGFGGAGSALVAASVLYLELIELDLAGTPASVLAGGGVTAVTIVLSILIGAVTFSGSLVAYLKLSGKIGGKPVLFPGRHLVNAALLAGAVGLGAWMAFVAGTPGEVAQATGLIGAIALALGVLLVIPIGGADMPVVISLLNSYSGVAAAMTGFVLGHNLLIIAGALVGASGLILTQIMCVAMNRTLANVVFGGFGAEPASGGGGGSEEYTNVRSYSAADVALILESAESVVFVPGYGLAVAQAQHTVRELADLLEKRGVDVKYAIHPVAGRMPGHMNVLLAEADVPYEQLVEMDRINPEFKQTDVSIVVGANDVVNPAAKKEPGSPIAGMPILEVFESRTTVVIKRSLSPGFAGIKNELFEYDNTMMVFGDAKQVLQDLVAEMKEISAAA